MSISPARYKWAYELESSHNGPIDAGIMAHKFEKFFEERPPANKRHLACRNFYCFVYFSRRNHMLCVRDLSRETY